MRLCMRILNAPEGEKLLTLDPPGGLVGRSTDSALVLGYDSVSRLHAELRHDGKDWWLDQRSQTSATLLDEQPLTAGTPRRLAPRGSLQFGRVIVEYHQQALPAAPPPPVEPPAGEPTLVLKRASVVIPQALLSQMSPVRVDAPEPAGPPPTLTRLPRLTPSVPSAAAAPSPPRPPSRPSPPPLPAEPDSPPTFIRPNRPPPPAELDSPPTVIRTNSPLLPVDLPSPPTLIRANRPPAPAAVESGPPPTMIRRNQPPPVPSSPTAGPAPAVRPVPRPAAPSGPMAAAQQLESAAGPQVPVIEHQHDLQPAVTAAGPAPLTPLQAERDRLRRELEQATAEVTRLKQSEKLLQDAKAALDAQLAALQAAKPSSVPPASPDLAELREKALELLQPFSRSLEQAGEALRQGTPEQARALLRNASFALADLRDLFQS